MITPFKSTLYNCKQATLLSLKREEGKISLFERITLAYHLFYCEPCRRFNAQWLWLTQSKPGASPLHALPKEARERIQHQLDQLK